MTDETAKTKTWDRKRMTTDVHELLTSVIIEASERAAARAVEATRECDLEATQAVRSEAVKAASKAAESNEALKKQAIDEAKKHARKWGTLVGIFIAAVMSVVGAGWWKLAGPEQAVEKAERAAEKAETKSTELDAAQVELEKKAAKFDELTAQIEEDRQVLVDGRIGGLETRVGKVEGRLAGQDEKLDALLYHQLGGDGARAVQKKAEKAEAQAVQDSGP